MSASTATAGTGEQASDLGFEQAFIIAGITTALIVALVALRFVFYYGLDVCCDLDGGRRRRSIAEWMGKMVSFWHMRRSQPPEPTPSQRVRSGQERAGTSSTSRLTIEEIVSNLPNYILSEEDLLSLKEEGKDLEKQDDTEEHCVCSICLNEMKVGDKVLSVKCTHIFHHDCLAQWFVSSSDRNKTEIECPNCRTRIHGHSHPTEEE